MEVLTANAVRRSTRVRVEIPVSVISLDRRKPFGGRCVLLIVSAQGCGFRSAEALDPETPIMMSDLPGGGSVTGRVASCVPLGTDGNYFLIGASLYTHGNIWGIPNPPADWNVTTSTESAPKPVGTSGTAAPTVAKPKKNVWPYNLVEKGGKPPLGRK